MDDLLEVENLQVRLFDRTGPVLAVRGVSLSVRRGEVVALVGESGCGKSVTALSLLRLLPGNAQVSGSIRLDGQDVLELSSQQLRTVRGGEIAMVFQEPMTSLNPAFSVGNQIAEVLRLHQGLRGDRRASACPGIAAHGQDRCGGQAARVLPARTLRRHASAGHYRHGAGRRAEPADPG